MRKVILILLLTIAPNLFSQNKSKEYTIVNHQVMMGETVKTISRKYLVPPTEIYKLNKFAVDGISQGMVLKIPVPVKDEPVAEQPAPTESQVADEQQQQQSVSAYENQSTEHRVQSGETISGLAQQYGVTVQAIKDANPKVAKRGLRADEMIVIPPVMPSDDFVNEVMGAMPGKTDVQAKTEASDKTETPIKQVASEQQETVSSEIKAPGSFIEHRVKSGETLSVLAQKFHVSVSAIKDANPKVAKRGLRAEETIRIPSEPTSTGKGTEVEETQAPTKSEAAVKTSEAQVSITTETAAPIEQAPTESSVTSDQEIEHKVKPGETLFGLSRKYNVSVDVIKKQNARVLARGLQVGQTLKIKPE